MNVMNKNKFGWQIARKVVNCREDEWPELVRDLYRSRRLSIAMHEMNNLQRDPIYGKTADAAIKRLGFH